MRWNVTVAAMPGHENLAEAVCHRLMRIWRAGTTAAFKVADAAAGLEGDALKGVDAVILVADNSGAESEMLNLLTTLEEAGLPVLVLLGEEPGPNNCFEFAGAMVDHAEAPDDRIAATLHGLLHR